MEENRISNQDQKEEIDTKKNEKVTSLVPTDSHPLELTEQEAFRLSKTKTGSLNLIKDEKGKISASSFYNYVQINSQAGGLSQSVPDYTNVNGGYGVFSSRINKSRTAMISGRAASDLYGKTAWHFVQQ